MRLANRARSARPLDSIPILVFLVLLSFLGIARAAGTNGFLLTGTATYTYDPAGALLNSSTGTYVYDAHGQLQQIVQSNFLYSGFGPTGVETNSFFYDEKGNLLYSKTGTSETIYTNVSVHETVEISLLDENSDGVFDTTRVVTSFYDIRHRLIGMLYQGYHGGILDFQNAVSLTLDQAGHIISALQEVDFGRDGIDGIIDQRLRTTFTLNHQGLPVVGIEDFLADSGEPINTWILSYIYDESSNLLQFMIHRGAGDVLYRFSYEHRGEVIHAVGANRPRNELSGVPLFGWDSQLSSVEINF